MKKINSILILSVLLFIVTNLNAQEKRVMKVHYKNGSTPTVLVSEIDSITFAFAAEGEEGVVINGVCWAIRNVDAPGTFAANPEDAGMFYQWNRKIGWSTTDPIINSNGDTKWDASFPQGDSWEKANDPCPPGWRVPIREEQASLITSDTKWAKLNGVNGRYFGSGEQIVFFPAAGGRNASDGALFGVGNKGLYWNGTPHNNDVHKAYDMYFGSGTTYTSDADRRVCCSIRCVKE